MIVLCPSCHTRYRHLPHPHESAEAGRCSRCDECVPLVEAKRTYVLVRPGRRGGALPIGMDDPSLADRVRVTALDAGETAAPAPLTYRVTAEAPPLDEDVADAASAVAETESGTEPAVEGRPRRQSVLLESLVGLAPPAAAAAVAYHLAGRYDQDPITWAALAGAAGLLVGWACLLWIQPKD